MRGITRYGLACSLVGGLLLACCGVAGAADLKSAHVSVETGCTRVVFDVSGPLDYKLFEIANPDRIVVDIRGTVFADGFAVPAGKGLLKSVRTGTQNKTDARVVFDLAADVRPKSFLLPPADNQGYRLVVELYPKSRAKIADRQERTREAPVKLRDVVVMIDPGHGGDDPGAIGSAGTREKNITLAVAREFKRQLEKQPGMRGVLTREDDRFVALEDRYHRAREVKADLFVSIHADAFTSSDARGSSVWMLSPHGATNEAARFLADRENNSPIRSAAFQARQADNTLAAVLLDLSQGATLEASGVVAAAGAARAHPARANSSRLCREGELRRAAFAGCAVDPRRNGLHHESARRRKRLNNPEQRELLASAILNGVRNYFRAAPPPGTQFAVDAERSKTDRLASRRLAPSEADDLGQRRAATLLRCARRASDEVLQEELFADGDFAVDGRGSIHPRYFTSIS